MIFTDTLKRSYQFRRVYTKGCSFATRNLVLYVFKNKSLMNHIGISVSKKVGNSVIRSRVTRVIREAYRLNESKFKFGFDLVFIARQAPDSVSFDVMRKCMLFLMKKHNLLN